MVRHRAHCCCQVASAVEAILPCHVINREAISFISGREWSQLHIFCRALLTERVLCQSNGARCDLPPLKYPFKTMNSKFKWRYKLSQWCKKCTPHKSSVVQVIHNVYVLRPTSSQHLAWCLSATQWMLNTSDVKNSKDFFSGFIKEGSATDISVC